jgi:photosystem II stability/assembly factor-like uncharacterized protein
MMRARILLSALFFAGFLLLVSQIAGTAARKETAGAWTTHGPYQSGVTVHDLALQPGQPNALWVGTNKGLYRSTDGGESWMPMNNGLGGFGALRAVDVEVAPTNPQVIYLGTWGSGVYRSTDGGASWQKRSGGLVPTTAQGQGVVTARDPSVPELPPAGPSYESVRGPFPSGVGAPAPQALKIRWAPIAGIAVNPRDADEVYAAVWFDGVYRTRDGGANWEKVLGAEGSLASTVVVNPVLPNVVYAVVRQEGIYSTPDSGENWFLISDVLTDTLTLAIDPTRPNVVYAGTLSRGVQKSENAGLSWTPVNNGLADTRVFSLAVSPSHPDTVYAGTLTGIYKSVDGGTSWTRVDSSVALWLVDTLVVDPTDPNRFYAGASHEPAFDLIGGVYRSTDGGSTLLRKNQGLLQTFVWSLASAPQTAVAQMLNGWGVLQSLTGAPAVPLTASRLYAGTWGGGVFRSTDGGLSWEERPQGLGLPYVYAVEAAPGDPNIVYAGTFYSNNGVYKSTDGGDTWFEVSTGLEGSNRVIFSLAVDPTVPDRVYAGTWDGVFKSTDGGASWRATTGLPVEGEEGTEVMALAINPQFPQILYAGTYGQGIYKSTDSGETWFPINSGLPPEAFVFDVLVDPQQPDIVYVATSNRVYKSENSGATWRVLDRGMPQEAVRALSFDPTDPRRVFAGTHSRGVYWSMDRGEHWAPLNSGLVNRNIRALHIASASSPMLYAGTDGEGAWALGIARLGKVFLPLVARNFDASQVSPRPTHTPTPRRSATPTRTPTSTRTPTPPATATPTPPPDITVGLEGIWTTDEADQMRMAFVTLDTIKLWLRITNSGPDPVDVLASWEVRTPEGFVLEDLSWSGTLTIDPTQPNWSLERQIPTDLPSGEYTFTGAVTYQGETLTLSAVFYLADNLVRADDFSDPASGWPTESGNPDVWELGYVDGAYRIFLKTGDDGVWSTPGVNLTDYVIEVDTWQVSSIRGGSGLAFGISDDNRRFYGYSADNQGRYRLERWTGTHWVFLRDWTATAVLNTGQAVNHLMVVRRGTQIMLYANGQRLATVTDGALIGGRLGVYIRSLLLPNVDARYDDYRAYGVGGVASTSEFTGGSNGAAK